ncbi:hypothetical protein [Providencia sp. PROV274]|uniref:hypothetical protein n=1 Tax=Providencia sp. PROV274 TaxID=2949961 RepID=UPI00234B4366|nr:hypothetical protein [Providencia sp. PROV274]
MTFSSLRSRLWQGMGVNDATGAFHGLTRGNLPMTQEKPVTGFSGRFMVGLLCGAV